MVGAWLLITVTGMVLEAAVVQGPTTVREKYNPVLLMVIVLKLDVLVLQIIPVLAFVVRRTVCPVQIVVGPSAVITGVATVSVDTVTFMASDIGELHPLVNVCTVKSPAMPAAMLRVVSPLLHRYWKPAGAVSITTPPWQMLVLPPAVMVGLAGGVTLVTTTVLEARDGQLLAIVCNE